jgi:hypothetical protein
VNRVVATQEGEARIGLTDYHLPSMSFQAARAMEIGILCGGKAAENDLGGRQSSRGILQDERDIRSQLDQLQALGSLDFTEEELLSHCEKRAHELIQLNKHAVLKLASLLSKEGLVEGSQLQAILSTVRVPTL